jgi:hypothetical protein
MAQVLEHKPSKHKALSSNSSNAKTNKQTNKQTKSNLNFGQFIFFAGCQWLIPIILVTQLEAKFQLNYISLWLELRYLVNASTVRTLRTPHRHDRNKCHICIIFNQLVLTEELIYVHIIKNLIKN